jgi:hypothetical protein
MPYVLGIDHVAFAVHDLEATCAQTIGLFVGHGPSCHSFDGVLQGPLKHFPL